MRAAGPAAHKTGMDVQALIAKYDTRVPRYTSYPTAPHFSAAVDGTRYAAWLGALPREAPISLYVHVPFCEELCLYCGCATTVVRRDPPRLSYAAALCREIDMVSAALGFRPKVSHIHWGGGTPTALPAASLIAIMRHLRDRFDVAADAEVAIELDPRHLAADRLAALTAMGVTRASLGVQDFDAGVQRAVGRIQSFATTLKVVEQLRGQGIASLNLDLMYGLPLQTVQSVAATTRQAVLLAPDRVAVFGYAHVPWMRRHQALIHEASLPGAVDRYEQMQAAERILRAAGYVAIGLDHYARPQDALARAAQGGTMRRNFQGYTDDSAATLLAFGASAIGALPQGYVQNAASTRQFLAHIRADEFAVERGCAVSDEDTLRADVIQHIMCSGRADLPRIAAAHDADQGILTDAVPHLEAMADDGLIRWNGACVEVAPEGQRFVRHVAAAFDAYLGTGPAAHARGT
jgi:oxygen-independent coproporphyrinogen-3 oxidase